MTSRISYATLADLASRVSGSSAGENRTKLCDLCLSLLKRQCIRELRYSSIIAKQPKKGSFERRLNFVTQFVLNSVEDPPNNAHGGVLYASLHYTSGVKLKFLLALSCKIERSGCSRSTQVRDEVQRA